MSESPKPDRLLSCAPTSRPPRREVIGTQATLVADGGGLTEDQPFSTQGRGVGPLLASYAGDAGSSPAPATIFVCGSVAELGRRACLRNK